jgi:hypothetical protein
MIGYLGGTLGNSVVDEVSLVVVHPQPSPNNTFSMDGALVGAGLHLTLVLPKVVRLGELGGSTLVQQAIGWGLGFRVFR